MTGWKAPVTATATIKLKRTMAVPSLKRLSPSISSARRLGAPSARKSATIRDRIRSRDQCAEDKRQRPGQRRQQADQAAHNEGRDDHAGHCQQEDARQIAPGRLCRLI